MEKFWKWFENKTGFHVLSWMDHNRENWKTNLIGHMAEYLFETRKQDLFNMVEWAVNESIEDLYNNLYLCIDSERGRMGDKRCGCGHGECWDCWMDNLDKEYEIDTEYRECECGMTCCAVCNYYRAKTLDKKGFIFLDGNKKPFKCVLWGDEMWLFYWHPDNKWVSLKKVSESEVRTCASYYIKDIQDKY